MSPAGPLWRSFPWDTTAAENEPFSAAFVPARQGHNRFDLTGQPAGVLYLAETPDHAIGEKIARFRGRRITDQHLRERGHPLGLVRVDLRVNFRSRIVDLCDPDVLTLHGIAPDILAGRDRAATQAIAEKLFADPQITGLRWWSAFFGDWHTLVLFRDRLPAGGLRYGAPEAIEISTPPLIHAAKWLGIRLGR